MDLIIQTFLGCGFIVFHIPPYLRRCLLANTQQEESDRELPKVQQKVKYQIPSLHYYMEQNTENIISKNVSLWLLGGGGGAHEERRHWWEQSWNFRDLEMLVSKWNLSSNPKIIDFLPNCIPYVVERTVEKEFALHILIDMKNPVKIVWNLISSREGQ